MKKLSWEGYETSDKLPVTTKSREVYIFPKKYWPRGGSMKVILQYLIYTIVFCIWMIPVVILIAGSE